MLPSGSVVSVKSAWTNVSARYASYGAVYRLQPDIFPNSALVLCPSCDGRVFLAVGPKLLNGYG